MKQTKKFFLNTLLLTAASMLLRAIGVYFQIYLSNKIGSSGIGLFQLVGSVQALAITISLSGIRFATTRMVSEELGLHRPGGVHKVLRHCFLYALSFGLLSAVILFFSSEYIGSIWIGDSRTILSLKTLSLTMPFISLTAVMSGYFTAVQRVIKTATVQLADIIVMIATTIFFINMVPPGNLEYSCAAIVAGATLSEIFSFFLLLLLFLYDKRRYRGSSKETKNVPGRLLSISMPLALSTYARSALSTIEHMLVPRGLRRSGASGETALATYGTIHGMVFPVLTFPSVLFLSISELIIPNLTENQVAGNEARIEYIVNKILSLCIFFSIGVAGIFAFFHREFALMLYHDGDVGRYILIFSFLMPVIYMDAITDGMLKGLGQQLHSMAYNIMDSFISVVLVYTLLPIYSISAYMFIVYFTECFNFFFSIRRISKITTLRIRLKNTLLPILSIFCSINLTIMALRTAGLPIAATGISLAVHIIVSIIVYCLLLGLFTCINGEDVRRLKKIIG